MLFWEVAPALLNKGVENPRGSDRTSGALCEGLQDCEKPQGLFAALSGSKQGERKRRF